MTPTSFFSSAHRPGVHAPKKKRGFLALPGEIRNQIYSYYFESGRRCEIASKGSQFTPRKAQTVKLLSNVAPTNNTVPTPESKPNSVPPTVVRFSNPLGKYNAVQGLQTNWAGSLSALSLVCRQVYTETVTFLYQKTTFVFDAPKRIKIFFMFASRTGIENITKLHLHYNAYGHPYSTEHLIWQKKHNRSWHRACRAAANELTCLRELEIWMQVHEEFPKFTLREKWLTPFVQFRRFSYPKQLASHDTASNLLVDRQSGLQVVKVHVRTQWTRNVEVYWADNIRLIEACKGLHQLYGEAIGLAIIGSTEEEAMTGFVAACKGKHAEWRNHLPFIRGVW